MAKRQKASAVVAVAASDQIARKILFIRGEKVLLDADLAELYQVETKVLVQAVRRNRDRFPPTSCFSSQNRKLQT